MTDIAETTGFIEEKSDHNTEEKSDSPVASVASPSVTEAEESTQEPDVTDDQEKRISKKHTSLKQVIEAVHWAIVFTCVLIYFVYLMDYYFDEDRNVKKYAVSKNIKEMPTPFIYVEFYSHSATCSAGLYSSDVDILPEYRYYLPTINLSTSISTKTLVEEHAESSWVSIFKESESIDGWMQLLYVPPKDSRLDVESKNFIGVDVACLDGSSTEVWYLIGNTGELMEHETVGQALDIFYYDCDRLFSGYEVRVTYEWYGFRNKLDDKIKESDYFASTIESTFAMIDYSYMQSSIKVSPNPSGRKTIFVTIEEISFWSVLSLVGGMFSVTSVLGTITVYLIWGYSLHRRCPIPARYQKFPGFAPKAELGHVREAQHTSFMERRLKEHIKPNIIELYQKISKLNQKIEKLEVIVRSKDKDQ